MRKFILLFFVSVIVNWRLFAQGLFWTPNSPNETTASFVVSMDVTKGNKGLLNNYNISKLNFHWVVISGASIGNSDACQV